MQGVRSKGEVGSDGRLRLDISVKLPAGTYRASMGALPAARKFQTFSEPRNPLAA